MLQVQTFFPAHQSIIVLIHVASFSEKIQVMGGGGGVEMIKSKGCSRFSGGLSSPLPSFKVQKTFEPMSPAASSIGSEPVVRSNAPFSGLVICVTGLSKGKRATSFEFLLGT